MAYKARCFTVAWKATATDELIEWAKTISQKYEKYI